jgi:signal peptidase I
LGIQKVAHNESRDSGKSHISPAGAIAIALIIFAVIKIAAIDILRVDGHSMEPGFSPGRIIIVDRLAYGALVPFSDTYLVNWSKPARNAVIVLKNPMDSIRLVKRVVALPGDKIAVENGILFIDSPGSVRLKVGRAPFFMTGGTDIVPDNKFLVLGDNLEDSVDSRLFGFVTLESIMGSVLF